jgi:hypothetical protein
MIVFQLISIVQEEELYIREYKQAGNGNDRMKCSRIFQSSFVLVMI